MNQRDLESLLVALANARIEAGPLDKDQLWSIIESHDFVFGVWQDEAEPSGVGFALIKGDAELYGVVDNRKSTDATVTAIPCREAEEAEALRLVFGEVRRQH